MQYAEFCQQTGLSPVPAVETLYQEAQESGELTRLPSTERIEIFCPTYHEEVRQAAAQITADPLALRYYNLLRVSYFSSAHTPFLPPQEGSAMRNFAPTLAMIALWENTEKELNKRGVGEETCARIRRKLDMFLQDHDKNFGYPATSEMFFYWAVHYLRPDLYPIGTLEFEVITMAGDETVYRHLETGEAVWLLNPVETDTAYTGTTYRRGGQEVDPITLPKSEYTLWAAPGDDVLSVHIPGGADLTAETCAQNYRMAKEFFSKHYPEKHFKCFYCRSWLMDPALSEILSEGSRIASFQRFFQRYPYPSNGKEVFVFVHPTPFTDYSELPERTSLERALKKRYLDNDPIFRYAGLHDFEEA